MPQVGKRKKDDPYDARNPGVKPYGKYGFSDSDLQREENERRVLDRGMQQRNVRRKEDIQRYPSGRTSFDLRAPLRKSEDGRGVGRDYDGPPSQRVVKRRLGRSSGRR